MGKNIETRFAHPKGQKLVFSQRRTLIGWISSWERGSYAKIDRYGRRTNLPTYDSRDILLNSLLLISRILIDSTERIVLLNCVLLCATDFQINLLKCKHKCVFFKSSTSTRGKPQGFHPPPPAHVCVHIHITKNFLCQNGKRPCRANRDLRLKAIFFCGKTHG